MGTPSPIQSVPYDEHAIKTRASSQRIFDKIAFWYDFLNQILSLGIASFWRASLLRKIKEREPTKLLDIATGTGDVLISAALRCPTLNYAIGIDLSEKMLEICRRKIQKRSLQNRINITSCDAQAITFPDESFDMVTCAFGIRNIENPLQALTEIYRMLQPGGHCLILEFSHPKNWLLRPFYLFYLKIILPLIGSIFSRQYTAYRYLCDTILSFPSGEKFCCLLNESGFVETAFWPLTGGIATIYYAKKPGERRPKDVQQ